MPLGGFALSRNDEWRNLSVGTALCRPPFIVFLFADGNLQNTDNSQFSTLNSQFKRRGTRSIRSE